MFKSQLALQTRILLLPDSNLHPLLYVGHRFVGLILAGRQRRSGSGLTRSYHSIDHGHSDDRYQQFTAARLLYQGSI